MFNQQLHKSVGVIVDTKFIEYSQACGMSLERIGVGRIQQVNELL